LTVLVAIALAMITDGVLNLALHVSDRGIGGDHGNGGLLLVMLGVVQLAIARKVWSSSDPAARMAFHGKAAYWRWLLGGAVVCFLLTLAVAAGPEIYLATFACWYTLTLLPLVLPQRLWQFFSASRQWGRAGDVLFIGSLVLISGELGARVYGWIADRRFEVMQVARQQSLPPNTEFRGQAVNQLGYWGEEFNREPKPGVFRIAAVGDGVMLSGTAETNFLAQMKRRSPNLEVYNFGLEGAGPREYAAQVACDITDCRPNLVLAFFSVGDDVTQELPVPGYFEWKGLGLYQLALRTLSASNPSLLCTGAPSSDADDGDRYLLRAVSSLRVCRAPIDNEMHQRWQASMKHLDDLIEQCRERSIPMALVIVPGEFQVNRTLREILLRRAGVKECQLDLELPQRRLAKFAEERDVPTIDLLPVLVRSEEFPYSRNASSLNDIGNAMTADTLGAWVDQRYGSQITTLAQSR
jgi:hypothetical protein